jgi:hypothetical protein
MKNATKRHAAETLANRTCFVGRDVVVGGIDENDDNGVESWRDVVNLEVLDVVDADDTDDTDDDDVLLNFSAADVAVAVVVVVVVAVVLWVPWLPSA